MSKKTRRKRQSASRTGLRLAAVLALVALGAVGVILALNNNAALQAAHVPAGSLPPEVSVAQAAALRGRGAFMLDVRQPDEWIEYHMPGSTLIPLDQLESRLSEVPRDQEIVVVCRSGNRSQAGREILEGAGFTQVTSMAGGLLQWRDAGYPTVSGP